MCIYDVRMYHITRSSREELDFTSSRVKSDHLRSFQRHNNNLSHTKRSLSKSQGDILDSSENVRDERGIARDKLELVQGREARVQQTNPDGGNSTIVVGPGWLRYRNKTGSKQLPAHSGTQVSASEISSQDSSHFGKTNQTISTCIDPPEEFKVCRSVDADRGW